MYTDENIPIVSRNSTFSDVILEMNKKRFGGTCVVNEDGSLAGIITDGDLKRILTKDVNIKEVTAEKVMSKNPKTVKKGTLAAKALHIMKSYNIMQIIITGDDLIPLGIVHLHDLLNEGFS